MEAILSYGYLTLIALLLQVVVLQICSMHSAMWERRSYFRLIALIWSVMPIAKFHIVDQVLPPVDGLGHEMIAREVADLLHEGRFAEALSYFNIGNNAYRFLVGVFYAVTGANETVTYAINGALGFIGLTMLVGIICIQTNCRRLPLTAIGAICLLPSGLLWTTANLKEGPVLWGICMMLLLTLPSALDGRRRSSLWPAVGFLVVALLRPHIAVAWLGAIGAGAAMGARRFGLLLATGMAAVGGFVMISHLAPDLFARAMQDGVSSTLSDRYTTLADNDQLNGVALTGSNPVPVWSGLTFLLLRPTPFEVNDVSEFLVGAEVWVLAVLGLYNWLTVPNRWRLILQPSVMTPLIALLLFGFFFSYMYNLGLAVRQRLMCFPAMLFIYFYPVLLRNSPSVSIPGRIGAARRRSRSRIPLQPSWSPRSVKTPQGVAPHRGFLT